MLREIFGKKLEEEKELDDRRRKKRGASLPEPWHVTDPVPHHGRGQYSVLGFFDVKKGETEFPSITKRLAILDGKLAAEPQPCRIPRKDCSLEHPLALKLLHRACYTCPAEDFIVMDSKFMVQRQQVRARPARRETRTHAHPVMVAGKKGAGRRGLRRSTIERCPFWRPPWLEAGVPAGVGPVSDGKDHRARQSMGGRRQHEHALPQRAAHHALKTSARRRRRRSQAGGDGTPAAHPLLPQPGVQGRVPCTRLEWDVCGAGGGGERAVCPLL